ncbi:hypothetical protein DIPPA_70103 [Diplonema papillatum]|nr:hypothetical protein DIPPA_70103 [Diplonema papillatum]
MTCKLAVLLSGSGTTLQNIFDKIDNGSLPNVAVRLVIASKADAYGLERARKRGVTALSVESKKYRNPETKKTDWTGMNKEIHSLLEQHEVDLVVLAGYMCLFEVPPALENRVINIHPALIPAFSGQGMYGEKVHKAVVERGVKLTGCTAHFVTNEYDAGPIIHQRAVPVSADDTWESVQARVQELEREVFPEAIAMYASGRLVVRNGVVAVASETS